MLVIFMGIAAVFQLSIDVVTNNRARAGAIALANERMEYLRSLSYTQIGVIGGIPAGNVPQEESVTLSDIGYTRRTMVLYSDDPQDGLGGADQNGIVADYKTIRVEVLWTSRQGERSVILVGRVSPLGVESAVPGGTLTLDVVNEGATPVADAQVDIINTGTVPAINIRTYTNSSGIVSFIGAPAASNYQITVSRPGYSTTQTYPVTPENPNPDPRHLTVVNGQTTSQSFTIDLVSTKTVRTFKQIVPVTWDDPFANESLVATSTDVEILGGEVKLAGSSPYPSSGFLQSVSLSSPLLAGWNSLSWIDTTPAQTDVLYRIYDGSGAIVPDSVLSGNNSGFSVSPLDLSAISTSTHPQLRIGATLSTNDPDVTPSIQSWELEYDYGPEPLPNLSFQMRGNKTIGNNPTVNKYDQTHGSGASAMLTLSNIEADTYTLSVATSTGYYIAEACNPQPEALLPNTSQTTSLYVLPDTDHSLLVDVRGSAGALLEGASVNLVKTGYDVTLSTSSCGQAFFEDLSSATYSISVSKAGYQTYSNTDVGVSGLSRLSVSLNSL
ncbi:hypothetical protein A3A39_02905 [Candidatus Kaiserbacteria bacterium RIFCSPLOWO2_01_FULL_54_13]|uniref:Carboxypeptidase regulatory-like domain-containing protein n=1 Tax=Candidatus Kaiserbacteria bacterium RIFCSPLOWO2_01_FULL_54_13 TaxID=1798512 RepID=A0A1F6F2Y3_9BACT|nr:MAG: hypothetical protein A3A39_02905 [Candidatus Kaiserbacteria bacterium RIFCSPLOWO2_01_FULL_54_13]